MNHIQKKQQGFDLFDFIFKNQADSIYCASNNTNFEDVKVLVPKLFGKIFVSINSKQIFCNNKQDAKAPLGATNAIGSNGLVAGHAYALIEVARFHDKSSGEVHEVVQIRNPWGETEWKGQWSDQDAIWNTIRPDEKAKYHKNAADGAFWMSFTDFLTEFEKLDICYVPDERYLPDLTGRSMDQVIPALQLFLAKPIIIVSLVILLEVKMHRKVLMNFHRIS